MMAPPPGQRPRLSVLPTGHRDERLLAGLRAGKGGFDRQAFDRFAPVVRRVLRRILGSGADFDDLTQETFLRLFRNIGRVRDAAALEPFVMAIVVRVARAELSHRWRRRWLGLWHDGDPPVGLAGPGSDHEARAAVRSLYALLDRQSPEARLLFVLRHIEQLELEEVAAAMAVSLATVKRKLARVSGRIFDMAARTPEVATYLQGLRPPELGERES